MLTERYSPSFLAQALLPTADWTPFPPARERAAWEALLAHPLNRARREALVREAESLLGQPWPALPATLYMEFARIGNRVNFETPYFQRRTRLSALVLAETLAHDGRFLDEIANGLWLISEEGSWSLPAHADRLPGDVLPRDDRQSVDLFACETAMVLAEACYLLRAELQAVSPGLLQRVNAEILRRVVEPVETRDDFWWLAGRNNWTPWCASNTLGAALYTLDDPARLTALTMKLMVAVDRFIGTYGPDGGCDEGPGYWAVAAGAMLIFLELLHSRTAGAVDIYAEPLIRNMGRFIVNAHLDGPWFTNFADAGARVSPLRAVTYRFGEWVGDAEMRNLALLGMRGWVSDNPVAPLLTGNVNGGNLIHCLRELCWMPADAEPEETRRALTTWLPDLQMLVARESPRSGEGLVLAAKGGHNDENHNHNDIGQFIVMLDGQPGIIDIGVETYTRQTFSDRRYELWCIRASGHNVPLVNGIEQAAGREHRATDVRLCDDGQLAEFTMNLAAAYPAAAQLTALRRAIRFDRAAATITVSDQLDAEAPVALAIPLHAVQPVVEIAPGCLAIATAPRRLLLEFDPQQVQAEITPVEITDARLRSAWGDRLYRITLRTLTSLLSLALTLRPAERST